jgi:LPXTG-motif cell wall-anchored protein
MRKLLSVMTAALLAVVAFAVTPAGAQSGTGTVTVVHGVPDLVVDVYVDDQITLEDFAPDTVTNPLALATGDHELAVRPANAPPDSDPILSGSATLPSGANASIVAHLDAAGQPRLTVFVNDVSTVASGQSRLIVRHTAAAPAVDVLANGTPALTNLSNPNEAKADLPAGTISAAVAATGSTTPVLGPLDLNLPAETATIVYAVGSLEGGSLKVLSQTVRGLGAPAESPDPGAPVGPASGELPRTGSTVTLWLIAAGLGLVATGVIVRRRTPAG